MPRRWMVFALATGLCIVAVAWLLSTLDGPLAAAEGNREVLLRQAEEIRALAEAKFIEDCSHWPPEYVDRYAKAVRAGILMGTEQPLSEAKMAELRAAVVSDTKTGAKLPGPEECFESDIAKTKFIYAEIVRRPGVSPEQEQRIMAQIDELGQFLEQEVRELAKRIVARAREQGKEVVLPPDVPAEARAWFEEQALRKHRHPLSSMFKRPLSAQELERIRSRFRESAHEHTSGPRLSIMLTGMGAERFYGAWGKTLLLDDLFVAIGSEFPGPHYPAKVQEARHKCAEAARVWARTRPELSRVQGSMLLLSQALLLHCEAQGQHVPYP